MIRPFQLGDMFLIQRLGRQSAKLNATQALLQPRSAFWSALTASLPHGEAKVTTYVLNQHGHRLARAGFMQVQKRPRRPEADIVLLAPALDTPNGHPAIWEKLLSYYTQEAARQKIARIYVDVPDQRLTINTFAHVGFRLYTKQTIWRNTGEMRLDQSSLSSEAEGVDRRLRPVRPEDAWALQSLYARVTPHDVQHAEGVAAGATDYPPILQDRYPGVYARFVLVEADEITGCLHIVRGQRGTWLRLWTDTLDPDSSRIRALLRHAFRTIEKECMRFPVYLGVNDYHGGLRSALEEYGFVPFTDRAKMVKHVMAWVREVTPLATPILKPVGEVITLPFDITSFDTRLYDTRLFETGPKARLKESQSSMEIGDLRVPGPASLAKQRKIRV